MAEQSLQPEKQKNVDRSPFVSFIKLLPPSISLAALACIAPTATGIALETGVNIKLQLPGFVQRVTKNIAASDYFNVTPPKVARPGKTAWREKTATTKELYYGHRLCHKTTESGPDTVSIKYNCDGIVVAGLGSDLEIGQFGEPGNEIFNQIRYQDLMKRADGIGIKTIVIKLDRQPANNTSIGETDSPSYTQATDYRFSRETGILLIKHQTQVDTDPVFTTQAVNAAVIASISSLEKANQTNKATFTSRDDDNWVSLFGKAGNQLIDFYNPIESTVMSGRSEASPVFTITRRETKLD